MRQAWNPVLWSLTVLGGGSGPPAITQTSAIVFNTLDHGETLSANVTWGTYTSSEGTITLPTTKEMSVNGGAFIPYDGATVVSAGDTYRLRESVSDDAANGPRPFNTAVQSVAGVVPAVNASGSLSSRTYIIVIDSLSGEPTPTLTLTSLTLDGVNVLGDQTGSDPWSYVVPDSASAQTVAWTVEASNFEGTATASGSTSVPANLFAPTSNTVPTITGTANPGETVTITEGTYNGTTPISVSGTLFLNGVDVTADMVGMDYTIPPSTVGQLLEWQETASNGITPNASQSVSVTVTAASSFLLDAHTGALFAYSLRQLSSSTVHVARIRRASDNAEQDFTADEITDGTLASFCTGTGGYLRTYYDQSGNGNDAEQTVAGQQARIIDNVGNVDLLNGSPAGLFDESRSVSYVLPSGTHGLSNAVNKCFYAVARVNSGGGGFYRTLYLGDAGSSKITQRFGQADPEVMTMNGFGNAVNYNGFGIGTDVMYWGQDFAGSQNARENNINRGSNANGGQQVSNEARMGGYINSNFWEGPIAELVAWDSDQSADRAAIHTEVMGAYGL